MWATGRRCACFELRRMLTPVRLMFAAAIIVWIGILAYQDLVTLQLARGGVLEGSTVWDVFYLALNNEWCCTLLFPLGVLVVAGDTVSRDQGGAVSAFAVSRGEHVGRIAAGKIAAVVICGIAFSAVTCVSLAVFDALAFHTPLSCRAVPDWLSYSGDTDTYLRAGPLVYALIPSTWSYGALLVMLVICEGALSGIIALFFMAIAPRNRLRYLPLLIALGIVLGFTALPSIWVKLSFLIRGGPGALPGGVSDVGMVLDRFCLASYVLGAGFWQTSVGGPALLAQELSVNPGPYPEGYLESIAQGYAVNSFGSLVILCAVMFVFSILRIDEAVRSSCQKMDSGRRRFSMSRGERRGSFASLLRSVEGGPRRALGPGHPKTPRGAHFSSLAKKQVLPSREPVVDLTGVTVRFGHRAIFEDATFQASRGEVVGLVGENGRGKTTLLMVLAGLLEPDEGTGHVLERPLRNRPTGGCGVLFDNPAFIEERSGLENLTMFAQYCRLRLEAVSPLLRKVGLNPADRKPVHAYSLGMRKRLAFALATMGDPPLLLLDEPLNGVDPVGVVTLRELIAAYARRGGTVVISSHMLDELQRICDRVYIVKDRQLTEMDYRRDAPGDLERAYLRLTRQG